MKEIFEKYNIETKWVAWTFEIFSVEFFVWIFRVERKKHWNSWSYTFFGACEVFPTRFIN